MTNTLTYEERQKKERDEHERRQNRLETVTIGLAAQAAFKGFRAVKKEGEYDPSFLLQAADGRVIYLSVDRHKEPARLRVTGRFPYDAKGRYVEVRNRPEITVAFDRDIETIGKDIARRFLPDYLAKFAEVAGQIAAANERHAKLVAAGKRIAVRLQEYFDPDRVDNVVDISGYRPEWIKVRTYDGEDFTLELTVKGEAELNRLLDVINPHKEVTT